MIDILAEIENTLINQFFGSNIIFFGSLVLLIIIALVFMRSTINTIIAVIVALTLTLSRSGFIPKWIFIIGLVLAGIEITYILVSSFTKSRS